MPPAMIAKGDFRDPKTASVYTSQMRLLILMCALAVAACSADNDELAGVSSQAWGADCINTSPSVDSYDMHPTDHNQLWVVFHRSLDGGLTWDHGTQADQSPPFRRFADGTPASLIRDLVPVGGGRIYRRVDNIVERSDDDGATWQQFPIPMDIPGGALVPSIEGEAMHAHGDSVIVYYHKQVFLSRDGGANFTQLDQPDKTLAIGGAWVHEGGRVVIDLQGAGLYLSSDDGQTWTRFAPDQTGRAAVSQDGDIWVVAPHTHGFQPEAQRSLYYSSDWGASWLKGPVTSGPFAFASDAGGKLRVDYNHLKPLGNGVLSFSAWAQESPSGRRPLVCVVSQDTPDRLRPLPSVPPADISAGTIAPYAWFSDLLLPHARIAVADDGTPFYLHPRFHSVTTTTEVVFEAVRPDPEGVLDGLNDAVEDIALDRETGELLLAAWPPKTALDPPFGAVLYRVDPATGKKVSETALGPLPCDSLAASIGSTAFAKCDNGVCDDEEELFCPSECGLGDQCGNGVCDDYEQFNCGTDCENGVGGTCGNLKCDGYEEHFCPLHCPALNKLCGAGNIYWGRPLDLLSPTYVRFEDGTYNVAISAASKPVTGPAQEAERDVTDDATWVLRDGWIRRIPDNGADPCLFEVESAHCFTDPGHVENLVASGSDGFLYAIRRLLGEIVRRPFGAETAEWETVVVGLLSPSDLFIAEKGGQLRLFILDGDLWVAVLGDDLPLRRSF